MPSPWSALLLLAAASSAVATHGVLRPRAGVYIPFNESTGRSFLSGSGTATAAMRCRLTVSATPTPSSYWMEDIEHRGISAFNPHKNTGIYWPTSLRWPTTDLAFYGGLHGALFANRQFTMRNLTFNNAVTAINIAFDWGWTFQSISTNNCSTAVNMSSQSVGSVTFLDSSISNTPIGFNTSYGPASQSPAHGRCKQHVTIHTARGIYIESAAGTIWLVGTSVEHHSKYQYQLANTRNIFMGQIQTETVYYQPNPNTTVPFPAVAALNDPTFSQRNLKGQEHGHSTSNSTNPNSADGWGLRVLNSQSVLVHGAGLYSFFDLDCSLRDVDGYNLHTIGTTSMINRNGVSLAGYATTSISSRIRLRC